MTSSVLVGDCAYGLSASSRHNGRRLLSLRSTDWDFHESQQEDLHSIHPYPAKFIPEIPRALISALAPRDGSAILDPFCGSGTTLVEAQRAGHASIGIDLNPIGVLLSRVKTARVPEGIGAALSETVERATSDRSGDVPVIPRLDHWFKPCVQIALSRLANAISNADPRCRDLLRLAMSSIIVRVSNQDSDTRYAAVDKRVTGGDVLRLFVRSTQNAIAALSGRDPKALRNRVIILEQDTLAVEASVLKRPVGLVVTSPPYPNAYEYWLYHKYRMWWLGFDPLAVKDQEIGARAHFFSGKKHTAEDFGRQMGQLANLLRGIVIPGGHICFVVGRSRIHGVDIDNAALIADNFQEWGFEQVFSTSRSIRQNRKSFNLSHANIKSETILVFSRNA